MKYELENFIRKREMQSYKVVRNGVYDFMDEDVKPVEFQMQLFIYKKTRNSLIANQNFGFSDKGQLNGYCLKQTNLLEGDIVIVDGKKFRVVELLPREHANFLEFTLGEVQDDQ